MLVARLREFRDQRPQSILRGYTISSRHLVNQLPSSTNYDYNCLGQLLICNAPGFLGRIIVEEPAIRKGQVHFEKISQTRFVSPADYLLGHVVSAFLDPIGNPAYRKSGTAKPKVKQVYFIPFAPATVKERREASHGQGRLEGEIPLVCGQSANSPEHQATRLEFRGLRRKWRQSRRDRVGVRELNDAQIGGQQAHRRGDFPAPFGPAITTMRGMTIPGGTQGERIPGCAASIRPQLSTSPWGYEPRILNSPQMGVISSMACLTAGSSTWPMRSMKKT